MKSPFPCFGELGDLSILSLGNPTYDSPLKKRQSAAFVDDDSKVLVYSNLKDLSACHCPEGAPPVFEEAGPRERLFFDPKTVVAGIVTCGGVCPGLNDVIRTITLALHYQYGVKKVLGFRYGYEGLSSQRREEPIELTPQTVRNIQHAGGTILGSSRGPQDMDDMVDTLEKFQVNMLFVIGGDGTFAGAHKLSDRIAERGGKVVVVGVPKTIDNDIFCSEKTFGFITAVEEARKAIASAHNEAEAAYNGVGLVKLMGRDSGFVAMTATLANSDVNFCLIPEVPFTLDGEKGLLSRLEDRLNRREHAVIVVAEGAGQDLMPQEERRDASGNILHNNIGVFLREKILAHFREKNFPVTVKYINPSYMIRSCPANAADSANCILFGQNAVHAAMAGKTNMFIGFWNHHFTHVPLSAAVGKCKQVDPCGEMWQTVEAITD